MKSAIDYNEQLHHTIGIYYPNGSRTLNIKRIGTRFLLRSYGSTEIDA